MSMSKLKPTQSRAKSNTRDGSHLTVSPSAQAYNSNNSYNNRMVNAGEHDKKISELLRNNDQLYQELRKANEKYLNQRVENNKLKDEIQML